MPLQFPKRSKNASIIGTRQRVSVTTPNHRVSLRPIKITPVKRSPRTRVTPQRTRRFPLRNQSYEPLVSSFPPTEDILLRATVDANKVAFPKKEVLKRSQGVAGQRTNLQIDSGGYLISLRRRSTADKAWSSPILGRTRRFCLPTFRNSALTSAPANRLASPRFPPRTSLPHICQIVLFFIGLRAIYRLSLVTPWPDQVYCTETSLDIRRW